MNGYFDLLRNDKFFDEVAPDKILNMTLKGFSFSLYSRNKYTDVTTLVAKWYNGFIREEPNPDFIIKYYLLRDIYPELLKELSDENDNFRNVKVITQSELLEHSEVAVFRWDIRALFNFNKKRANVILLNEHSSSADAAVRIAASLVLPYVRCIMIHGSSVSINGNGYLFFGKSGSGKSTIAGLSNSLVLNDEISLLAIEADGSVKLSGTPFYGDLKQGVNKVVPLKKIFLLKQDKDTYIEPMSRYDQMTNLLQCVITFMTDKKDYDILMEICKTIIDSQGIEVLHFEKNTKFMDVIL